jgi:hypothetical protein
MSFTSMPDPERLFGHSRADAEAQGFIFDRHWRPAEPLVISRSPLSPTGYCYRVEDERDHHRFLLWRPGRILR